MHVQHESLFGVPLVLAVGGLAEVGEVGGAELFVAHGPRAAHAENLQVVARGVALAPQAHGATARAPHVAHHHLQPTNQPTKRPNNQATKQPQGQSGQSGQISRQAGRQAGRQALINVGSICTFHSILYAACPCMPAFTHSSIIRSTIRLLANPHPPTHLKPLLTYLHRFAEDEGPGNLREGLAKDPDARRVDGLELEEAARVEAAAAHE